MPQPMALSEILQTFLRIGLSGFGGVLAIAHRELVDRRRWLSDAEFAELLGIGQVLPGSNLINLAIGVGLRRRGWMGAVAAVAGLLVVPAALAVALFALFDRWAEAPWLAKAVAGMAAAATGLLLATGLRLTRPFRQRLLPLALCAATFAALGIARWPLAAVLAAAVAASVLYLLIDENRPR